MCLISHNEWNSSLVIKTQYIQKKICGMVVVLVKCICLFEFFKTLSGQRTSIASLWWARAHIGLICTLMFLRVREVLPCATQPCLQFSHCLLLSFPGLKLSQLQFTKVQQIACFFKKRILIIISPLQNFWN